MASSLLSAKAPGLLLAGAMLTSLPVLWFFATPILSTSDGASHVRHGAALYLHVVVGLAVLFAGAAALFIGWTRRAFKRHKWFGYAYLGLGSVMALSALALSFEAPHPPRSLYVATGTLAAVWLAVAAMAFRAAKKPSLLHTPGLDDSELCADLDFRWLPDRYQLRFFPRARSGERDCCNLGELDRAVRHM